MYSDLKNIDKFADKIDWCALSYNNKISHEIFTKHNHKYIDWEAVNSRKVYAEETNKTVILAPAESDVNWHKLTRDETLTEEFIKNNIDKPWNWRILHRRVSIEFILENSSLNWNWYDISKRNDITINHILQKKVDWDWFHLTRNKAIKLDDMLKYPYFNWNWRAFGERKELEALDNLNSSLWIIQNNKEYYITNDISFNTKIKICELIQLFKQN